MPEQKNYRFPGHTNPTEKKKVRPANQRPNQPFTNANDTNPVAESSEQLTSEDIRSLIKSMNVFVDKLGRTTILPAYASTKFSDIEYTFVGKYTMIYNRKKDVYIFGGNEYSNMSFESMLSFIENNYSNFWMSCRLAADVEYLKDFCNLMTTDVCRMISHIASEGLICGNGKSFLDSIDDVLGECLEKYEDSDEDDSSSGEDEITAEDSGHLDPNAATPKDAVDSKKSNPVSSVTMDESEIQRQVEEEDEEIDMNSIPSLNPEEPGTETSNIRKYAAAINDKISDEDMMAAIRAARAARPNRSFQQAYVPQKQ